ncbi:MAG: hypothetical protein ACFE9S_17795 [Candidatus Hermodarchaeota archaeon]
MTESMIINEKEALILGTTISGYFAEADQKAIRIRLPTGSSFWIPKHYLISAFSTNKSTMQEFVIDTWILKKIGFDISKA